MKIVVYGTLKEGYGNNRLLSRAKKIDDITVAGYKLYYAGFPVAAPCADSTLLGELYELPEDQGQTLSWLDRLESEGRMYNRVNLEDDTWMYVGHPDYWPFTEMKECPKNEEGSYVWS